MATVITGPKQLWDPKVDGTLVGQPAGEIQNPFFDDLFRLAQRGLVVEIHGATGCVRGITDYDMLTVAKAAQLVAIGGEIENYPAFVEIPVADYTTENVPDYLPSHENVHADDTTTPKKWDEWTTNNNPHLEDADNSVWLIPLNYGGPWVAGSVLAQLVQAGYTVKCQATDWPQIELAP